MGPYGSIWIVIKKTPLATNIFLTFLGDGGGDDGDGDGDTDGSGGEGARRVYCCGRERAPLDPAPPSALPAAPRARPWGQ